MRRGSTLIELMVTLAILGLAGAIAGNAVLILRSQANEVAQRERALQCLEFEAAALLTRNAGDPGVRAQLLGELPDAMVDSRLQGQATVVTVSWQGTAGARLSRSLAVLSGGRR